MYAKLTMRGNLCGLQILEYFTTEAGYKDIIRMEGEPYTKANYPKVEELGSFIRNVDNRLAPDGGIARGLHTGYIVTALTGYAHADKQDGEPREVHPKSKAVYDIIKAKYKIVNETEWRYNHNSGNQFKTVIFDATEGPDGNS